VIKEPGPQGPIKLGKIRRMFQSTFIESTIQACNSREFVACRTWPGAYRSVGGSGICCSATAWETRPCYLHLQVIQSSTLAPYVGDASTE
jgi:hypothetical protein